MTVAHSIPAYGLYGESLGFPDVCHIEQITDRAAGHDWVISPHRHEDLHQVIAIQSGEVVFSRKGKQQVLSGPVLFNLPRREVHGFHFEVGTVGHVFSVPTSEMPEILGTDGSLGSTLAHISHLPLTDDTGHIIARIAECHTSRSFTRTQRLRALGTELLCLVAEPLSPLNERAGSPATIMERFDAFVLAHLGETITVPDIASALAVSPSHLNRLVKSATGLSPLRAVEALRMREACRELAYTKRSISDIGATLSYQDPSYFSRAFHKHMGLSPRDYRSKVSG